MRLQRYIKATTASVILLVLGLPYAGQAQQTQQNGQLSLGVSPAISEVVLEAGKPKNVMIMVSNLTQEPLPVKGIAASLDPLEEVAKKDRAIFDAASWIRIAEPDFILQPRQQKPVNITVTPPPGAEPGGHYATIFFHPLVPSVAKQNNAAYVGSKVGVVALMTVPGDRQEKLVINNFTAPALSQHGPINFELQLRNAGNIHVMPTGSIGIYNALGKRIATLPLPPRIVLPKTTKRLTVTWDNKNQVGYYMARADISYGTKQPGLHSQPLQLWILPWFSTVVVLVIAGVVGLVGWRTRGRWRSALGALFGS